MKKDLEERKPHGSKEFPLQCYCTENLNRRENFVASHWHDNIEIIQMHHGYAQLIVEGQHYTMREGELWFCNPREIHQITSMAETGNYHSFVFSLDVLGKYQDDYIDEYYLSNLQEKWLFPRCIKKDDTISSQLCHHINNMYLLYQERPSAWQMEIRADLYLILALLIRNQKFIQREPNVFRERSQTSRNAREMLQYLEKHYHEKITLEEVASIMHFSPRYFCAFFKENFFMSFISYLNRYRIDQACILLQSKELTITEIALRVGFDNISYFIRKFKEIEGCTPKEYRKKLMNYS